MIKENISSHFLPQLIGINKFTEGFVNAYIMDLQDDDEPFTHIYILMERDSALLDIYPYTANKREVPEGNLYKIAINSRFYPDLEKYYQGKYSKMSDEIKNIIIEFSGVEPEKSLSYNVLYKTDRRREFIENLIGQELLPDEEVMSILDLSKNVYGN